jgi:hypothetical protein
LLFLTTAPENDANLMVSKQSRTVLPACRRMESERVGKWVGVPRRRPG